MKKVVSILVLVLVFAFTLTTQAQKKERKERKERTERREKIKLSTEQQVDLAVKKMTLKLDLTEKQQREIKPLIAAKVKGRKAAMEKRKEFKKAGKKPTSDELYAVKSKMLDNQIAAKNKMKNILNKEQFEKFEKMNRGRKMKGKKMMKKKGRHDRKEKKEHSDN